jgi:D-alanine-D-alanine ligase
MRIGILFDRPDDYPEAVGTGAADRFAEFEPESTIQVMEAAVRHAGHEPVRLGGPRKLLAGKPDVDLVWSIAEGYGTRNREAWAPVLLEMHGIPVLGSDALTLSVSLDKKLTKTIAASIGISIPEHCLLPTANRPLLAKPRYEGTAKGLSAASIVETEEELQAAVERIRREYGQDAVVEPFLPGPEFTVALIGEPLIAYPVMERALDPATRLGSHVTGSGEESVLTHSLTPELDATLQDWSLRLCAELGVRHFARLDFKCDEAGNPFFLEINTLPTFAVDGTFAILAEMEGVPYAAWLGERVPFAPTPG